MADIEDSNQASSPPPTGSQMNRHRQSDAGTAVARNGKPKHNDVEGASRVNGDNGQSHHVAARQLDEVMEDQQNDDISHSRAESARRTNGDHATSPSASTATADSISSSESDSSSSESVKSDGGHTNGPIGSTSPNIVKPPLARLQRSAAPSLDFTTASNSESDESAASGDEVRDEGPGGEASRPTETASQRQPLSTAYGNLYRWTDMPGGATQNKPALKEPLLNRKEEEKDDSTTSESDSSTSNDDDDDDDSRKAAPSAQRAGGQVARKSHRALKCMLQISMPRLRGHTS